MNVNAKIFRLNVEQLKKDLAEAESQLEQAVANCQHQWTEPVADHIYHESYTIPGDPPGTCGIDWRGPTHVDATTEKRWKRECKLCGELQYTGRIRNQTIEHPDFS